MKNDIQFQLVFLKKYLSRKGPKRKKKKWYSYEEKLKFSLL